MKLRSLIGEKVNMSQMSDRHGRMQAVTLVRIQPNTVVKQWEKKALVAYGNKKRISKPLKGTLKDLKDLSPILMRELIIGNDEAKVGEAIKVNDVFRKGDLLDVVGTSKGKGFAGGMKRHGFHGGPKTHGQSDRHRAPGSIGSGTTPGRVLKGLKMAGHMGVDKVTVQGLEILEIDEETGIIKVKGAVPGGRGTILLLNRSIKKKKAYHEPEIPATPIISSSEEPKEDSTETTTETVPVEQATEPTNEKTESENTNG